MYYSNIFGWFNNGQRNIYDNFVKLADNVQETNILEIGCFLGKSSMYLAEKIKESGKPIKLHCVDYFQIRDDWPKNIKQKQELLDTYGRNLLIPFNNHINKLEVQNIVIPYQQSSNDALDYFIKNDYKFEYIFIDGGHDYLTVKNDIEKSLKVIKQNGIIAGDDYFTSKKNDQVQKAVDEIFGNEVEFLNNEIWIVNKNQSV